MVLVVFFCNWHSTQVSESKSCTSASSFISPDFSPCLRAQKLEALQCLAWGPSLTCKRNPLVNHPWLDEKQHETWLNSSHPSEKYCSKSTNSSMWRKDFKISGQIGEPGQKDRLTFSSLTRQIENGINKGYRESEMTDAIICAITPGLPVKELPNLSSQVSLPGEKCHRVIETTHLWGSE